jgi:hypothetical protein
LLALPHGMPSPDPFGRVFARLHPQRLQACFLAWTQAVAQCPPGALLALDGQTVKASWARATASSPLPMVSAWCAETGGLVLGPVQTDTTSNEMTAIPALLHLLALKGWLGTLAARGCQTASAHQIRDQEGDSL